MRMRLTGLLALWALATTPFLPAAGLARTPATVEVTKSDCTRLVKHLPDPGASYRPGVDVHGQPVVPADVGGQSVLPLPEAFEIDIEVDLQQRFGIPANQELFDADAQIGRVVVERDGRAYFNGVPLHDEAVAALIDRCQEIFYGREER